MPASTLELNSNSKGFGMEYHNENSNEEMDVQRKGIFYCNHEIIV